MIRKFPCTIPEDQYKAMCEKVLGMNTGIEAFMHNEMVNRPTTYHAGSGLRITSFTPSGPSWYVNRPFKSYDGTLINCECIEPPGLSQKDIIFIHGAGFQRPVTDINLKTAERMCDMTHATVYVPDYRIGVNYTHEQMVMDVVGTYEQVLRKRCNDPSGITFLADSSGGLTTLQAIRYILDHNMPAPGYIVLWSPQADCTYSEEHIIEGKIHDIAFRPNELFSTTQDVYAEMTKGMSREEKCPLYGDYSGLKDTKILIAVSEHEMLYTDSLKLYAIFKDITKCTLEVYEKMFHNFQMYYSVCEMSKTAWESLKAFLANTDK